MGPAKTGNKAGNYAEKGTGRLLEGRLPGVDPSQLCQLNLERMEVQGKELVEEVFVEIFCIENREAGCGQTELRLSSKTTDRVGRGRTEFRNLKNYQLAKRNGPLC